MTPLIWVDGQKRVRAIMAEGDVTLNGKVIFSADKMAAVVSLAGHDIRDGKPLAVMSMWAGTVKLPANAGDTAVTGDIHDGKWRVLETRKIDRRHACVRPAAGSRNHGRLARRRSPRAGEQVEAWVMRPWEAAKTKL